MSTSITLITFFRMFWIIHGEKFSSRRCRSHSAAVGRKREEKKSKNEKSMKRKKVFLLTKLTTNLVGGYTTTQKFLTLERNACDNEFKWNTERPSLNIRVTSDDAATARIWSWGKLFFSSRNEMWNFLSHSRILHSCRPVALSTTTHTLFLFNFFIIVSQSGWKREKQKHFVHEKRKTFPTLYVVSDGDEIWTVGKWPMKDKNENDKLFYHILNKHKIWYSLISFRVIFSQYIHSRISTVHASRCKLFPGKKLSKLRECPHIINLQKSSQDRHDNIFKFTFPIPMIPFFVHPLLNFSCDKWEDTESIHFVVPTVKFLVASIRDLLSRLFFHLLYT